MRVKRGVTAHKKHKKYLKQAKGYYGARSKGYEGVTGRLVIMGATSKSRWQDWKTLHVEKGPFVNEMIGDPYRWKSEGVLSVLVQNSPPNPAKRQPMPLRILDFKIES